MVYTCDTCHYVFEDEKTVKQCPDCGKVSIRAATVTEERDYRESKKAIPDW